MENHVLSHCIRRYICAVTYCSKRFTSKTDLLLHQNIHSQKHPADSFICQICSAAFKSLLTVRHHFKEHSFVCGFSSCPEVCNTIPDLAMHRASHIGCWYNNLCCPLCKSPEMNRNEFDTHLTVMHPKFEFLCGFCGHSSISETQHKTHKESHHRKPHSCMVCGKVLLPSHILLQHQILKHPVESQPGHFCKFCIMEFDSTEKLTAHMEKCLLCVGSKQPKYLMNKRVKIQLVPNKLHYYMSSRTENKATVSSSQEKLLKTRAEQKELAKANSTELCIKEELILPIHNDCTTPNQVDVIIKQEQPETIPSVHEWPKHSSENDVVPSKQVDVIIKQEHLEAIPSFPAGNDADQGDIFSVCIIQYPPNANYYCATCRIDFSSEISLQDHFETHDKLYNYNQSKNNYECTICSIVKKTVESIETHVLSHCIRRYICAFTDCSKRFTSKTDLLLHQNIHCKKHPEDSFVCLICSAAFKSISVLRSHFKGHSFLCEFSNCSQDFKSIFDLAMHRTRHADSKRILFCPLCKSSELHRYEFDVHLAIKHPKFEYLCGCCGHLSLDETLHKTHKDSHYGKNYTCMSCHKVFMLQHTLIKHQLAKHSVKSQPGYFCKYCIMEFDSNDELTVHTEKCLLLVRRSEKTSKHSKYLMADRVKIQLLPNKLHNSDESKSIGNGKTNICSQEILTETVAQQKKDSTLKYCYFCASCSEKFYVKTEVEEHVNKKHPKISNNHRGLRSRVGETIKCLLCDFKTEQRDEFRLHVDKFHKYYIIAQESVA